jgi:hypothetical protein
MPLALRLTAATLFSCALVHCAPQREQPLASAPPDAPPGAVVGSPNPAMLALLIKARAK